LGRSPVSIAGTYYDLGVQLSPDPDLRIALELVSPAEPAAIVPVTVRVRTRPIHDRNGNLVPDGTRVDVSARSAEGSQLLDTVQSQTRDGIAEASLSIVQPGRVAISAQSGETVEGAALLFVAQQEPTPTPLPATATQAPTTRAPTATVTVFATRKPTATQPPTQPAPTPVPTPLPPATSSSLVDAWRGQPSDLLGMLGGIALALAVGFLWRRRMASRRWLQLALATWTGGLVGYMAYGWTWIPASAGSEWPGWALGGLLAFAGALLAAGASLLLVHRLSL
jgi:hypothetical protein